MEKLEDKTSPRDLLQGKKQSSLRFNLFYPSSSFFEKKKKNYCSTDYLDLAGGYSTNLKKRQEIFEPISTESTKFFI